VRRGLTALLGCAAVAGSIVLAASTAHGGEPRKARKPKARPAAPANFDVKLPVLGTHLPDLPPGPLKTLADQACLTCHSGDMLRQQRLNEKQWAAEVDKMVGWGSDVPQDRRQALIAYLVANFGPANDTFRPVVTRPVGR
jgi:hypothetical protein